MKKLLTILFVLVLMFSFWNCERDDLCPETIPTTPKLVIEFYDFAVPLDLKSVTNLGIIEPTFTNGLGFSGVSKIQIPLRTTQDATTLLFIQNGSDTDPLNDNSDEILFNYSRKEIYISRACGYRTVFNLDATTPFLQTPDSDQWIKNIVLVQPSITNDNETHLKIYF